MLKRSGSAPIQIADTPAAENFEGERKTVTALFADIKGSMDLIEDLDPEEARAIVDPALKLMMEAVQRYGGYVAQSTGDGIFAIFGAPIAHEDHPQCALYAALRMQGEMQRYSAKLREAGHPPVEARVGVNTGEVVMRSLPTGEGGHTEYVPVGHSISLAARMEVLAPVGSIATTQEVRSLCEGYFLFKPLGPTRVKGVSDPVNVYEVTGQGPLRTHFQLSTRRGLTRFVGRGAEMVAIARAAELVKAGHGQLVCVVAEPGVGKSRLLYEFKVRNQSGYTVLEAFSVSHGKASAYLPVIDLLHSYFRIAPEDDTRTRREKVNGKVLTLDRKLEDAVPYLLGLLGLTEGDDPLATMDVRIRRQRTLEALKRILVRESLNQPLMVVFEDLHWIDEETQAFLNLLADSIGTAKLLLLVTYRPEYSHKWSSRTYYTQLRLDPLGKESAGEMFDALLGESIEVGQLKRLIIEKTEGTPFFIEETIQALFEDGTLIRNGQTKITRSLNQLRIPTTVRAMLASRIDRLPAGEKELLQTLSVIGTQFPLRLAAEVTGKPEPDLTPMLSSLQQREFIYEQLAGGDLEYTFKHALTHDVAYNSILNERRKLMHERVATAIDGLWRDHIDDHLEELAHHYSNSGDTDKAVSFLLKAGILALRRGGYQQSIERFSAGLNFLKTLPVNEERTNQELDLQLNVANAMQAAYGQDAEQTASAYQRARELCELTGRTREMTEVLGGLRNYCVFAGRLTESQDFAQQNLGLAKQTGDQYMLAHGHYSVAHTSFYLGEFSVSLQHSEESRSICLRSRESWARLQLLYNSWASARPLWFLGLVDQALERTRDGIALIRHTSETLDISVPSPAFAEAIATGAFAEIYGYAGEDSLMVQQLDAHHAINQQYGLAPVIPGRENILRGWLLASHGQVESGLRMMQEGVELNAARHNVLNAAFYSALLAKAFALAARIQEGLETLERAMLQVEETGGRFYQAELFRLVGELKCSGNSDANAAEGCFLSALKVARSQQAKSLELRATTSLARLLAKEGKRDGARAMLAEIYNWFTEGFDTADLKDARALLDELKS